MKNKKTAAAAVSVALSILMLAGCSTANTNNTAASPSSSSTAASTSTSAQSIAASTALEQVSFDSSDYYYNWQSGAHSTLDMSGGSQTITKSGVYEITGTLADGSLIVDVDKSADKGTVYLVLNNADITSLTSAPVYIKGAKKVVLILENGTTNTVKQSSSVTVNDDNEPSAAVFSKADLTITGSGMLNVLSDYNDGITCKDTLKITDGTLVIQATKDGITGKDLLAVDKGDITITAGKDGMRATNTTDAGMGSILIKDGVFDISAGNDAIQAYSVLQLDGGSFDLTSGGGYAGTVKTNSGFGQGGMSGQFVRPNNGSTIPAPGMDAVSGATSTAAAPISTANGSTSNDDASDLANDTSSESDSKKCLKADGGIIINGGTILTSSYEDALNSKGDVTINGGVFTLSAGDDGIHADAGVTISGGTVTIQNSYEGIEGKNITVNNGDLKLTSSDDGFNVNDSAGLLTLGGGTIYANAGGDGLDSNGSVNMTGGTVYIDGPTDNGNGAIDYNTGFTISGGVLVAAGSSGMAQTGDANSSQPSILMYYTAAKAAGTEVAVKDESGNTVASFIPAKQYSSAAFSAPGLQKGQTYTIYSGDTKVVTFTLTDAVTYLNESGVTTNQSMGPGGNFGGGGQFHGGPNGIKPGSGTAPGSGS